MNQNVNLLVVDDDPVDVEALQRALLRADCPAPCHVARHGRDALQLLEASVARADQQPMIVLLDLNMPLMNGIEFLDLLRMHPILKGTIVFVITTSDSDKDKADAYQRGVAGYFVKDKLGDDFDDLVKMLARYAHLVEYPPLAKTVLR